jgi:hypothetical protein
LEFGGELIVGTNFYTLKGRHIAKRSAAGLFCWSCGVSLRIGGELLVHSSRVDPFDAEAHKKEWYDKCPICGDVPKEEDLNSSAAGRELGFNKGPYGKKTGVSSCSSFSWAIPESELKRIKIVKDEYGRRFTIGEFSKILEECPIRFFDSIGVDFC